MGFIGVLFEIVFEIIKNIYKSKSDKDKESDKNDHDIILCSSTVGGSSLLGLNPVMGVAIHEISDGIKKNKSTKDIIIEGGGETLVSAICSGIGSFALGPIGLVAGMGYYLVGRAYRGK